jgi:hypothetical protein
MVFGKLRRASRHFSSSWPGKSAKRVFAPDDAAIHPIQKGI